MRHLRKDYEAIQPWPTKRPHHAIVMEDASAHGADGEDDVPVKYLDLSDDALEMLGETGATPIIPDDEPVFILRAKDRTAPEVVLLWADLQLADVDGDHETARAVQVFAEEMRAYAEQHYGGGKLPDTPVEFLPIVTKTGRVLTDDDVQALADEAEAGYDPARFKSRERPQT